MSLQYSGGPYINRVFAPSNRQDWCNNVTQAISDAGWTTISGTPGSGNDVVLETPAQSSGCKIRCRILEPGSGNCAQVTIRHPTGATADSQINYCLPGGGSNPAGIWRIVANPYTFYTFLIGGSNKVAQRCCCIAGTLMTPSFLGLSSGDGVGFIMSGGSSDTDISNKTTWRSRVTADLGTTSEAHTAGIWTNVLTNMPSNGSANYYGQVQIPQWAGTQGFGDGGYRWEDGTWFISEAYVAWGTSGLTTSGNSQWRGQLYDAMLLTGQYNSEQTLQLDGHTWLAITDLATLNQGFNGSLFVAIS